MSKREKLIDRMRHSPKTIRFDELDALLAYYGFQRRQSGVF